MYYHMDRNIRTIYLAGGCFWGVEGYFQLINGVKNTEVGYANGKTSDTDYQHVGQTDHAETVRVDYDRTEVSLGELLLRYFRIIDPSSLNKQGNDRGRQYRTGIYYTDEADLPVIEDVMAYEATIWNNIVVEVEPLRNWIDAEDYHQDYLANNPLGYCHINLGLARQPLFKKKLPRRISPEKTPELYENLTQLQRAVMLNSSTERPWSSPLEDEYRPGIYVDRISGEPLFASSDKFDSGCGWPAFSKAILSDVVKEKPDFGYGMERIEVRSNASDSHLGHVFQDGPMESGGLRYCINGAALRFIPYDEMDEEGYGDMKVLIKDIRKDSE